MKYLLLFSMLVALMSCQKGLADDKPVNPDHVINCDLLKQGLLENNVLMVDSSLGNLLNTDYSEENMSMLADTISKNCDIKALLICFECIETLPAQSAMTLTFLSNGDSTTKELDFTYGVNLRTIVLVNVQ
jgi:hypothetical protein